MSNRFRRLKLTHTLRHGLSSNRLAPFPDADASLDATMKADRKSDRKCVVANGTAMAPTAAVGGNDISTAWTAKSKDSGERSRPVCLCMCVRVYSKLNPGL